MKIRHKLIALGGAALAASLVLATPVAAMDCVVVNRSTQGALGASNSSQWVLIDLNAALSGCISSSELQAVDTALTNAGLPLVFDTRSDKTLPNNGHGIQHIDTAYIPIILAAAPDAGACLGG